MAKVSTLLRILSFSWPDLGSLGKYLHYVNGDLVILSCHVLGNVPWAFLVMASPRRYVFLLEVGLGFSWTIREGYRTIREGYSHLDSYACVF